MTAGYFNFQMLIHFLFEHMLILEQAKFQFD